MKSTELRIGNIILYGHGRPPSEITAHDIFVGVEGRPFKPVPLSEEWLLKAGCVSDGKSEGLVNYWNEEYDFSVDVETVLSDNGVQQLFFYRVSNNRSKHLAYLHQLQNLHFALKGEELTFKN